MTKDTTKHVDEMDVTASESDDAQLKAILEAVVYITDEPLSAQQMAAALQQPIDKIKRLLDEIVAEAAPGHVYRLETTGPRHGREGVGHRPDLRVDGEVGPVVGEAAAGRQGIEAARPKSLVALGGAAGAV